MSDNGFLIINRRPPYGQHNAREALDLALTSAVFEVPVALLFLDDGVLQLLKDQAPQAIGQKNLSATLQALELYDIERIYVAEKALAAHQLSTEDLCLAVEVLDANAVRDLIQTSAAVFTF